MRRLSGIARCTPTKARIRYFSPFRFSGRPTNSTLQLAVAELRQRLDVLLEVLDVDAVRDDVVVAGEVLLDVLHGGRGDRDLAIELALPALDQPAAVEVEEVRLARGVPGADVDGRGVAQELDRQLRHERLVHVDDVEVVSPRAARLHLPAVRSDSVMRATEPLTRRGIGRPMIVIGQTSLYDRASRRRRRCAAAWPRSTNCSARWLMWLLTPPDTAQSYGETSAIFIGRRLGGGGGRRLAAARG